MDMVLTTSDLRGGAGGGLAGAKLAMSAIHAHIRTACEKPHDHQVRPSQSVRPLQIDMAVRRLASR